MMDIHFLITCDYDIESEEGDLLPPGFRILSLTSSDGRDYTFLIDPDRVYQSFIGVAHDIAQQLDCDPDSIGLEEV